MHLGICEINDPLFPLVELCCNETSLAYYRNDINRFTRASCCHNVDFRPVDFGEMYYMYKRLSYQIELLFVLMHQHEEWKLSLSNPLYQCTVHGNYKIIHDEDMYEGTTMQFWALATTEFANLQLFMHDFFKFKSLGNWRRTMDGMFNLVFSEESFSEHDDDARHIFEYLDKLGEAMFVAYEIRGKAYMLEHYADRFGIKKDQLADMNLPEIQAPVENDSVDH